MVSIVTGSGLGLFNASPNVLGGASAMGQAGDRSFVNAATGNLVLQALDERLSGRGLDLLHLRTHNSRGALNDPDGDGWRWNGEHTVTLHGNIGEAGSTVTRTDGDGHETEYAWNGSRYVSSEGDDAHDSLVYDSGRQQWVWTGGTSRRVETYAAATGRLVSQQDTSGNNIVFQCDDLGRLSRVIDSSSGQRLALTYMAVPGNASLSRLQRIETQALTVDASGRATETLGPPLKQVEYAYDASGRLTSVKTDLTPTNTADSAFYITTYTYDGASARIASVTQSDGTSASFTYDTSNRVKTVTDANGTQTFTYDAVSVNPKGAAISRRASVSVDVGDGNPQTWSYFSNGADRLTKIETPGPTPGDQRLTNQFHYDADGNLDEATDARGNTVIYQHDGQGNRTLERDALGNTVLRSYDDRNRPVTETRYRTPDPDGAGPQSAVDPETMRFAYDGQARLRFVVSAGGRVSENRYGTAGGALGLLTHSLQYTGGRYDVSELKPLDTLSETQLAAWVVAQDKTQVQQTQYVYDFRGNLSQRTDFSRVDAAGVGVLDATASVTEYIYDGHGDLLQTIVVRGNARDQRKTMASIVRDGLGRELQAIDASGTRTTVYDDANRSIRVTTGAGLVETRSFDNRGRLVGTIQDGGGAARATQYVYDAAGRLRMTADAQGGRRFNFYDAASRLQYQVDSTGAVIGFEYDATGQASVETRYRTLANSSGWYDSTTQTVTKNSLVIGSDVVVDAAHDRITRYEYDAASRLTTLTDVANTSTQTIYDGLSRTTQRQIGDRTSRFFYDRDGRQVGVVDSQGYLTEYKYDAGGRQVETVRYNTRSPAASNVAAPVWVGSTNFTATAGRPFTYYAPAYDADGDSLIYRLLGTPPTWLTLDTSTGVAILKGTPPLALANYSVTLQADDQRGKTSDVTVNIAVVNTAPSWTTLTDSTVAVNTAIYSLTLPAAIDNESTTAQLTYSILSPLPPGLSFDAAQRKLSGTPSVAGVYALTARVTDPQGLFVDKRFTLTVTSTGPRWTSVPTQELWIGEAFSMTAPAAVDPQGQVLTYSAVSIPAWLNFNTSTRVLSGTPTSAGAAYAVLRAQNPGGEPVMLSFGLNMSIGSNSLPTWEPLPLMVITAGSPANYTPPAAVDPEGQALTYSAVSGLPAGLSVDPATGSITGTLIVLGMHTVVLRATDPRGGSVVGAVSLDVRNGVPVYHGELTDQTFQSEHPSNPPQPQVPIKIEIPTRAFTDPNGDVLTYTARGMPNWLSFDPSVRIFSGYVPLGETHLKVYDITVVANDGRGGSATGSFTLTVQPDPNASRLMDSGAGEAATASSSEALATPGSAPPLLEDMLFAWRPTNTDGLRSYLYYDGQGRVVGSVDERGFLSETLYDAQANAQRNVRYLNAVAVTPSDTLATLRTRAGAAKQTDLVEYDDFSRVNRRIAVDGTVARNEYDSSGRLVRGVAAADTGEQRANRIRYNAFGEVTGTLGGVGEATLAVNPPQTAIDTAIAGYGVRYEYDELGRRAKSIDANGNATLLFYDGESRLTHTINAAREISETVYDRYGQAESMRLYADRIAPENLNGLTGGSASQLQNKLPAADPAKDQLTRYEYDRRGFLVKQTDGEGYVTTRNYTAHGQVATEVRAIAAGKSVTTRFDYDLRGALMSQNSDVGGVNLNSRTTYDASGRVIRSADAAGKLTATRYEDNGRKVEVTDALNRSVRAEYDALGRMLKQIDASGQQTVYTYDDAARSVSVTTPEGVRVTTRNTRHGQTLDMADGRGGITAYEYNKDGQLTKVTDALGRVVRTNTYDGSGRLSETSDALGLVTRLGYDNANRVVERHAAAENLKTAHEFNALGQQVRVTEGAGSGAEKVTSYQYDRKGQLKQVVVDPEGLQLSTRYTFDGLGNTVTLEQGTVRHPGQQVTRYEFDGLGRRVKEIAAPSAVLGPGAPNTRDITTEYRYDAAGRLSRTIDANGQSTWYVYDAAGQQTHMINAEGEVSQNTYDANGRLARTRRYLNRLGPDFLVAFGDVASAIVPSSDPNDARSSFVYDNDGRVRFTLTAAQEANWVVSESRYDANGNVIESRRYDKYLSEARLNALDTAASPGITVAEITAELAALGYSESDATLANIQRTRFAYDANNRLRFTVDAQGAVSESVYGSGGNVLVQVRYAIKPTLSTYTESAIDVAVKRNDANNQVKRFAYDSAGRLRFNVRVLASDAQGVATQHLVSEQTYDALGRMVQSTAYSRVVGALSDYGVATLAAAVTMAATNQDRRVAFVYDAAGRQVYNARLIQSSGLPKYLVTRQEYDALGRLVQSTAYATAVWLENLAKPTVDSAVLPNARDRTTTFVFDALGRQRFVAAANGSLSETVYDALGQVIETRRFDLTVDATTVRTEAALSALRGGRKVGDAVTRGEKYAYDRAGRVLTTTDANGFIKTSVYNGLGDRIRQTEKNGALWTYGYDRQGRMFQKLSPPVEAMVQLNGDSQPVLKTVVLEDRFYRDAFGNPAKTVERANTVDARTTDYTYDTLGQLVKTALHGHYDPNTGKVEKDSGGSESGRFRREIQLTHDTFGNVVRTLTRTNSGFQPEYNAYDALGRLLYAVDALAHVTAFTYNAFGEQQQVTRHSVTISGTPANASHWVAMEIATRVGADVQARTIATSYDNVGRKVEVRQPTANYYYGDDQPRKNLPSIAPVSAQAVTRYEYNAFGDIRREAVKLDATRWQDTWRYFDAMGREIRNVDALSHHIARTFDALGNLVEMVEFAKPGSPGSTNDSSLPEVAESDEDRISSFTYDVLNQQTGVQRKGFSYTRWNGSAYIEQKNARTAVTTIQSIVYDRAGNVIKRTDAAGAYTSFSYDHLGRLTGITEPARVTAGTTIADPFRNQISASPTITMTLDVFGNIVKQTRDPDGGLGETLITMQSMDAAGNVISTTDANGNQKFRQYDYAGRVVKETQLVSATLGNWVTNTHTLERRYAYDAGGRQTDTLDVFLMPNDTMAVQSGRRSTFNAAGEVIEERKVSGPIHTSPSGAIASAYSYDNAGHMVEAVTAEGTIKYYYNHAGQVTRQEHLGNSSSDDGTVARIAETAYDDMGRPVLQRLPSFDADVAVFGVRSITPLTQQAYDRWGNVVGRTHGGHVVNESGVFGTSGMVTTTYQYNVDNQLSAERPPAVIVYNEDGANYAAHPRHELRYDMLGRAVQEIDLTDNIATPVDEAKVLRVRSRHYDTVGQLVIETDGTDIASRYAYDAHGNRVGARNALGTVLVDQFDKNGNIVAHCVLRLADDSAYIDGSSHLTPVARAISRYRYDQADRRVGSADVMNVSGTAMYWSYTKFDERGLALAQLNASNVQTVTGYDVCGYKLFEQDANNSYQTWSYNTDGWLLSSTVAGDRTTTYTYNDFGQIKAEIYPDESGKRVYEYHDSGLLKSISDQSITGTFGIDGGADYCEYIETTRYEYSTKGEMVKESYNKAGTQEIGLYDNDGYLYEVVPVPIDTIARTTHTSYNELGLMKSVWTLPDENPGRETFTLQYQYDDLGNRRNVHATYTRNWASLPPAESDEWYTYDAEGRMRVVDGHLENGQIKQGNGTVVAYDAIGRRLTADKFYGSDSSTDGSQGEPETERFTWDIFSVERYGYNDLNHLTTVHRHEAHRNYIRYVVETNTYEPQPDSGTGEYLTEERVYDVRGGLIQGSQYGIYTGVLRTSISSTYHPDGQLWTQDIDQHNHPEKSSKVVNEYDPSGNLRSYTYQQGSDTSSGFTQTYGYKYSEEFGGYKEKEIKVSSTLPSVRDGITTNNYDFRGRLLSQSIVNPSDVLYRSFSYANDGQIVTKHERARTGSETLRVGKQDYSYAQGRLVATLGTGTLHAAHFSNDYTPISASYPRSSARSHVVCDGDTLADIAQLQFGDGALWYLIAEANSVGYGPADALPSTEIGRNYRIPNVVGNVHNNAGTFLPYSPADIIGDATPWPGLPPPPPNKVVIRVLATAVIAAVAVAVTAYSGGFATAALGSAFGEGLLATTLGLGIGAAAGSAASQGVGIALQQQDGFSGRQVVAAGLVGSAAGFTSALGGFNNGIARIGLTHSYGRAANILAGVPQANLKNSLIDLGTQLAIGGAYGGKLAQLNEKYGKAFAWSGAIEQISGSALNPQSGWLLSNRSPDWADITSQAVGAFTTVAVGGAIKRSREARARRRNFRVAKTKWEFSPDGGGGGGGGGGGDAPTIEEVARQAQEFEDAGYDALYRESTITSKSVSVNGAWLPIEFGIYKRGSHASWYEDGESVDPDDYIFSGEYPALVVEIEVVLTPDERAREAGTTSIISAQEHNRQREFQLYYAPWMNTPRDIRPPAPPRPPRGPAEIWRARKAYQEYRADKAPELYRNWNRNDGAAGVVNGIAVVTIAIPASYVVGSAIFANPMLALKGYLGEEVLPMLTSSAGPDGGMGSLIGIAGGFLTGPGAARATVGSELAAQRAARNLDDVISGTITKARTLGGPAVLLDEPKVILDDVISGTIAKARTLGGPAMLRDEPKVIVQFGRELYDTADDAARGALGLSNPHSIRENVELGGLVYRTPDGRYGYTGPIQGNGTSVDPAMAPIPSGAGVRAGDYHTHGDYSKRVNGEPVRTTRAQDTYDSNNFSGNDLTKTMADARNAVDPQYTGYLGTPSGQGRAFTPFPDFIQRLLNF